MTRELVIARLKTSLAGLRAPVDVAAAIERKVTRFRGDFQSDPTLPATAPLKPAAVLVPLVEQPAGLTVLLTQRTTHLPHHAGQISFPGGRIEPGDESAAATALREAHEEIGLPPSHAELVGRLDDYITGTGFVIAPIVGLIRPFFPVKPDPTEVVDVFEVPLAFVLDPVNHKRDSRMFNGVERRFYSMPFGERYIWGATAAMLINLYEVLRD